MVQEKKCLAHLSNGNTRYGLKPNLGCSNNYSGWQGSENTNADALRQQYGRRLRKVGVRDHKSTRPQIHFRALTPVWLHLEREPLRKS